ncbi:MAG: zinc-binding dehydrogenase [Elusimicrobia bacterium]|nr:zinc-binding dehydrogenase [Elusimicrobiota bacterium]
MKAVLLEKFGGPENLRAAQVPDPVPGPGEILVRVRACALNHLDIWVRAGIPAYKIALPHILGCDIAGEAAGGNLKAAGLAPGQRVVLAPGRSCLRCEFCDSGHENRCPRYGIIGANGGPGGYAELIAAPARAVFPAPQSLSDVEVAAFPLTFLTAWHMLATQARLRAGQTVLVLGVGSGVGVAAIQIAALCGARVLAASTSRKKLAAARALGVQEEIHSPPEDIHRKVTALTDGRGVDVVFEHIGPAVFSKAIRCLKPGGILVTCGATTGPTVELDLRYVFSRELRIQGSRMGSLAEFRQALELVSAGKLKPVVDSVFPLEKAAAAQEHLASGKQFGKVVLTP